MGHYIFLSDNEAMEVSGAFIRIILNRLREVASSEECMEPLIGGGNYEWHSSVKALPLSDLDSEGLKSFSGHLEDFLEDLPRIALGWNRPEFQAYFRERANELLEKVRQLQRYGVTGGVTESDDNS